MTATRLSKRDKIIILLKEGETSPTVIANKVGCGINYVFTVRREFFRSHKP